MTLLISLANDAHSIVLGDRRLVCNGKVTTEESNKICVLFCDDAKLSIAYTGLAVYAAFRTQDWLRETLFEIGKTKHYMDEVLAALETAATAAFSRLPPSPTGFLVSGFRYSSTRTNECYFLSNFDSGKVPFTARREFKLNTLGTPGAISVEAAGFSSILTARDFSSLRRMLESNNPPYKILHKAVEILQRVSIEQQSKRLIGGQCNSAVTRSNVNTMVSCTYHSTKPTFNAFGPDVASALSGYSAQCTGMRILSPMLVAGPQIRKQDLCWCESGKRFGNCHFKKFGSIYTKLPVFRKPMTWRYEFRLKQMYASGQGFGVTGAID